MILYFDTETTGLHPGQICQLSYIMQEGESITAKNLFFTVDSVDFGAYMVHGLSVEKLRELSNGHRFSDYVKQIEKDFSCADVIVSHNTAFDFMFMRAEFERLGIDFLVKNSFCSMKKMTAVCKLSSTKGYGYKYPKLSELCKYFCISDEDIKRTSKGLFGESACFHDARFDTTAVFLAVSKGIKLEPTMSELKKFCTKT